MQVRPITIKVIDKETKMPLRDIPVYYGVISLRSNPKILFVIPNPEPDTFIFQITDKAYTDASGVVSFSPHTLLLRKSEKIYEELVYINLDLSEWSRKAYFWIGKGNINWTIQAIRSCGIGFKERDFMNPFKDYRGFYICSANWIFNSSEYATNRGEVADIMWNSKGLLEKDQSFVIELERSHRSSSKLGTD